MKYNPQTALLAEAPPSGPRWIHELKLDGFRMGIFVEKGTARIVSRRGNDYTGQFPEIVADASALDVDNALLDGEVVILDERGISSFQRLQQLGTSRRGLAYFAFDLLALNESDIGRLPLEDRKRRLEALIARSSPTHIRYCPHFEHDGSEVLAKACALGAEGIVSKVRDAPYRSGSRSPEWIKTKCLRRQEFVVGGFTDSESSREVIGSLLIGYYERGALRFAGKVGNGRGWTHEFSRELRRQLGAIEIAKTPFDPAPEGWLGKNAHWVQPRLVAEVQFSEWTQGGHVRHPTLQGFRGDKRPGDVARETPVSHGAPTDAGSAPAKSPRRVFPRIGVTHDDLVSMYDDIADWALPHVEGRPLTLVRMRQPITREDALRTQAEFVRHTAEDQAFVPPEVPRIQIAEQKKVGEYCYVNSKASLMALVGAGVIEWHVWNARVADVERPDRLVFDLDPGPGVEWPQVVDSARSLRAALNDRGMESWLKTTGGKGLHVVAPLTSGYSWDAAFAFSREIASEFAEQESKRYTVSFTKADRDGKILIDYKRNYRTSIAVAGFSLRARPNAAMSVPVSWRELGRLQASDQWTVENIRARLRRLKTDPWHGYFGARS